MKAYRIIRCIRLAYAHRLQAHPGKCRNLHGHNGEVRVTCEAAQLDAQGMVLDFSDVRERIGSLLDRWDHKAILQQGDPLAAALEAAGQDVVRVSGPPTAEVLAEAVFLAARDKGLPVVKVEWLESEDCRASCEGVA